MIAPVSASEKPSAAARSATAVLNSPTPVTNRLVPENKAKNAANVEVNGGFAWGLGIAPQPTRELRL
jgi:hypothetical protein